MHYSIWRQAKVGNVSYLNQRYRTFSSQNMKDAFQWFKARPFSPSFHTFMQLCSTAGNGGSRAIFNPISLSVEVNSRNQFGKSPNTHYMPLAAHAQARWWGKHVRSITATSFNLSSISRHTDKGLKQSRNIIGFGTIDTAEGELTSHNGPTNINDPAMTDYGGAWSRFLRLRYAS